MLPVVTLAAGLMPAMTRHPRSAAPGLAAVHTSVAARSRCRSRTVMLDPGAAWAAHHAEPATHPLVTKAITAGVIIGADAMTRPLIDQPPHRSALPMHPRQVLETPRRS